MIHPHAARPAPATAEVVVVGAGPNGLMLGCELALAGISVVVLERRERPEEEPKANGLLGQVVRLLDHRGLYERLAGRPGPPAPMAGHFVFGALPLNLGLLDHSPVDALAVPQARIVAVLTERAVELGVEIRRGHALEDLRQDDDAVDLVVDGPDGRYGLRARFVVGADGGRSATRKRAGIGFPGVTYDRTTVRTAHATVPTEYVDATTGMLNVPGLEPIAPFLGLRTERGGFSYAPFPDHPPLISTTEWDQPASDEPMSLSELEASVRRVLGADLPLTAPDGDEPRVLRRLSGGNTRIAERFRDRRVLLVGDAAHVYGSTGGGPGLNLGLADAVNLGWKLAATLRGTAPPGLLDSYERERRPAAERMALSAQAQAALLAPGADVTGLRELFGELLADRGAVQRIAELIAGTDARYDVGDDDTGGPVGRLAPEMTLRTAPTTVRLAELTVAARPVLVDLTDARALADAIPEWQDEVNVVRAQPDGDAASVTGLLLRPDGYVAWASTSSDPTPAERTALREAVQRWIGPR
jgi:2-polyprenyl-6-methoxyphenol hydroxylase-like FAD-dependent oxidoreductase